MLLVTESVLFTQHAMYAAAKGAGGMFPQEIFEKYML